MQAVVKQKSGVQFRKYQGLGNDFVLVMLITLDLIHAFMALFTPKTHVLAVKLANSAVVHVLYLWTDCIRDNRCLPMAGR